MQSRAWLQLFGLFLLLLFPPATGYTLQLFEGPVQFSRSDFSVEDQTIYITDTWKFQPGDNLQWADPEYDDNDWEKVSTYLGPSELPFIEWEGIGWFRLHLQVDSTLVNYPLALLIEQHNGASQIYLDGELIYDLGEVSIFEEDFVPYRDSRPRPIRFTDTTEHVLAVRYANHKAAQFNEYGFTAGFRFLIGDLNYHIQNRIDEVETTPLNLMFYGGGLLAFTIIHFLLFVFYPMEKRNLYFALFTGLLALISYTELGTSFSDSPMLAISYYRSTLIAWILTIIYALRFTYSLFFDKTPYQFWVFAVAGVGLAVATWFNADGLNFYRELFLLLTIIEILRVLLFSFTKKKEGVWIIAVGLVFFVMGILFTILANMEMIPSGSINGNLVGSVVLIFSMSIYLSRDFARTQKRLEHKLVEVKHLSERSLEQERINKQKELERKLLAAENERKTKELEEARALQLSMLPKQLPNNDYWDISVFMETAHEVGGDYYDFSLSKNGTMTVALGDATGHGMKAGIMVATAKSYFHTLANEHENLEMIRRMSSGIKNMDLKLLYMSMMLLKCDRHNLRIASAGMPPSMLYRQKEQCVERITLKGMPLGSKPDYPYHERELSLSPGDTLLLMSDGLMELFNEDRELLGLDRIESVFKEAADSSASDILSQITRFADQWAGTSSQEDDMTILVMKAKESTTL
ncbi:SpoIIE family protein phosphatase [Aliifodinibius sp. S!AR15-10]|uniref:PP2C family protein-serine/threonine phosphatase n=1 Tax=Aliifodinibius sp. S!AR15-10 TaxID=2950437 RepID=UPI00285E8FA1|nr:SpoIIE family protein phosphatase [Aliifodinibius sp. S!AR15-10]MDR8391024.1 SpoIIE family protein phosphatase [Aliifodinibius sp. S!AR15-10]